MPVPLTGARMRSAVPRHSELRILGYTPEQMLRPHFLEDPKLALTLFFLASAAALVVVDYVLFLALAGPFRRLRASFRLRASKGPVITVHDKPD